MKILIVEDDFFSRKYLSDLLKLENFECRSATNGEEGLKIWDEYHPDVIISDIQMPILNGLEMLEAIRNKSSNTIVIMTTAFGSEEFAIQALRLGANNYLKKPITDIELLPILEKYKAIIRSRNQKETLPGTFIRREFSLEFETNINYVPQIVERLIEEVNALYDNTERTNIELGLNELLTNAIEHGNLEITSSEKNEALAHNALTDLYLKRLERPEIKARKVRVDFRYDLTGCQWVIYDEGFGFDWESIPNPTRDGNLLELSGRGIFITRFLFDELEFMGSGNIVRVKKYFFNS